MEPGDTTVQTDPVPGGEPPMGGTSGVDLQQLVLKSETVVDDVLKQHLRLVQRQQEKVYEELLSVQVVGVHTPELKCWYPSCFSSNPSSVSYASYIRLFNASSSQRLADYIPLLQLQQKHELRERCRQHEILRDLRVLPPLSSSPSFGLEDEQAEKEGVKGSEAAKQIKTGPTTSEEERQQMPVTGEAGSQEDGEATAEHRGGGEPQSITRRESIRKKDPAQSIPVDMLVNVGCNTYLRARGGDVGKLLIKVGFEFYLELTLDEALEFLSEKEKLLFKKYAFWSGKCADIKAQIQVLLQAIAAVVEEPALQVFPFA
ncbi:alpha subunit [Cystoisospora suis]|uniref:Alpha subunit n=1 Tax=Cystoisospora suis TaxID=483139 RepID=A0A2C6L2W0_9APIC|nr:alpha subunit [Cystoisospora suis]